MSETRSRTPVYILLALGIVVIVLIVAGVVAYGTMGPKLYSAQSPSMAPEIQVGDRFMTSKIDNPKSIQRGWVVVFTNPDERKEPGVHTIFKRVVGLPGDKISSQDGKLYINGQPADEPYVSSDVRTWNVQDITIPDGSFYLLGDNRENSYDSRQWGPVNAKLIHHHATEVTAPASHRHKL